MMLTPTTTWCLLILLVILATGLAGWLMAPAIAPEADTTVPLIDDHGFDGGWHQRHTCQFIYEGEDWPADTVCSLPREEHATYIGYRFDALDFDEDESGGLCGHDDCGFPTLGFCDVEDGDLCEGHHSADGLHWVTCNLPYGHRRVPEVDEYEDAKRRLEEEDDDW